MCEGASVRVFVCEGASVRVFVCEGASVRVFVCEDAYVRVTVRRCNVCIRGSTCARAGVMCLHA